MTPAGRSEGARRVAPRARNRPASRQQQSAQQHGWRVTTGRAGRPVAARLRDAHERHGARALLRARLQAAGLRAQAAAQRVLAARREPTGAVGAIRDESRARQRAVPGDVLHVVPGDRERDGLLHSIGRQSARGRRSETFSSRSRCSRRTFARRPIASGSASSCRAWTTRDKKFYHDYWTSEQQTRGAAFAQAVQQWNNTWYPKLSRFLNNTQQASGEVVPVAPARR